jgi:hypothetical protein
MFESVVERCVSEGLVGGEGFAIDASVIKADANRGRKTAGDEPIDLRDPRHATRAVREYLAALDEQGEPSTPPAAISPNRSRGTLDRRAWWPSVLRLLDQLLDRCAGRNHR